MSDMSHVIQPKSDQLNADDLIAGPMTITVTKVDIRGGQDQPVSIHWQGGEGRPYKACKSMCRVLVMCWGADAGKYVGRSMTLYRDPDVKWGGMAVGGIRISHLSHIGGEKTMMLTATKGSRKPFRIMPLDDSDSDALKAALAAISKVVDNGTKEIAKGLCAGLTGADKDRAWIAYQDRINELKSQTSDNEPL